jgi:hypothetical protein
MDESRTLPPDYYPPFPEPTDEQRADLVKLLRGTCFACVDTERVAEHIVNWARSCGAFRREVAP